MFLLVPVSAFVLRVLMFNKSRQAFGDTAALTAGGG
jgi:uncharacterized RDD family membrane protein YckC